MNVLCPIFVSLSDMLCRQCSHVASVVVLVLLILLKEHEVLKKNKNRGSNMSVHVL